MTRSTKTAALAIVALYWAMLIAGMVLCIAVREVPSASLAPVWAGTVLGTVLGHTLAACRVRVGLALVIVIATAMFAVPYRELGPHSWHAFVPAAMCAFFSLGDRTTLIAFWYPAVLWMLPVVEHTAPDAIPDATGLLVVGGLAVAFVAFLHVREARRVALWLAVSPAPLAATRPLVVLREPTGLRVSRATSSVVASALAFAGAAWLAPALWGAEPVPGARAHVASPTLAHGLPCCPAHGEAELPRARVKEYFHLGNGHDTGEPDVPHRPGIDCQRCDADGHAWVAGSHPALEWRGEVVASGGEANGVAVIAPPEPTPAPAPIVEWTTADGSVGFRPGSVATAAAPVATAAAPAAPIAAPAAGPAAPAGSAPRTPAIESLPQPAPSAIASTATEPAIAAVPPSPQPAPVAATHYLPQQPRPASAPAPAPAPAAPPPVAVEPVGASSAAPSLLQIVALALGALLAVQLVMLALRPLRRLVTIRHLRQPYWQETVDQRVSNAWQLALVGLRDAGWCPRSNESPRDLARRVNVEGVDQCATVLERARHGVGLDADDLATMTTSAETAYDSARRRLGPVARAVSWLRWPLT